MTAAGASIGPLLAARLCRQDDACAALCTHLVRLLAEGQPVSRDRLAAALGCPRAAVDATLRQVANLATDERGDIVAAGLSLVPTPHRFQGNGHALYTWCALDTLLYPLVLGQRARVASRCPVSGMVPLGRAEVGTQAPIRGCYRRRVTGAAMRRPDAG